MVDETTKKTAMKYAVAYKDIYLKEGPEAYGNRIRQDYEYGFINHAESFVAQRLSDIYLAIAEGRLSRNEGRNNQNALFDAIEIEDDEVVRCDYTITSHNTSNEAA